MKKPLSSVLDLSLLSTVFMIILNHRAPSGKKFVLACLQSLHLLFSPLQPLSLVWLLMRGVWLNSCRGEKVTRKPPYFLNRYLYREYDRYGHFVVCAES
jgi:hypothetical protein